MKLWSATNGYMGYGPVAALVVADTEAEARVLASAALRADDEAYPAPDGKPRPSYWEVERIDEVELPYVGDTLP